MLLELGLYPPKFNLKIDDMRKEVIEVLNIFTWWFIMLILMFIGAGRKKK